MAAEVRSDELRDNRNLPSFSSLQWLPEPEGSPIAKIEGRDFEFFIRQCRTTFGRESARFSIDVPVGHSNFISRRHIEIRYETPNFFLHCNGKNGIFVDGVFVRKGTPFKLPPLCVFRFPSTNVKLTFQSLIPTVADMVSENSSEIECPCGTDYEPEHGIEPNHERKGEVKYAIEPKPKIVQRMYTHTPIPLEINIPCNRECPATLSISSPYPSPAGTISAVNSCPTSPRTLQNSLRRNILLPDDLQIVAMYANHSSVITPPTSTVANTFVRDERYQGNVVPRKIGSTTVTSVIKKAVPKPYGSGSSSFHRAGVNDAIPGMKSINNEISHGGNGYMINNNNNSIIGNSSVSTHGQSNGNYNGQAKPPFSYAQLIVQAVASVPEKQLTLSGIYSYITKNYPYYRTADKGWQNSIRHNLSLNRYFLKVARSQEEPGKGCFWRIDPASQSKLIEQAYRKRRQRGVPCFRPPFPLSARSAPTSPNHITVVLDPYHGELNVQLEPLDYASVSAPGSPHSSQSDHQYKYKRPDEFLTPTARHIISPPVATTQPSFKSYSPFPSEPHFSDYGGMKHENYDNGEEYEDEDDEPLNMTNDQPLDMTNGQSLKMADDEQPLNMTTYREKTESTFLYMALNGKNGTDVKSYDNENLAYSPTNKKIKFEKNVADFQDRNH